MAIQWYAVKKNADASIIAYCTDDVTDVTKPLAGTAFMGPYPSLSAAQTALQPSVLSAQQQTIVTLSAKPSANWVLQDIADWLKAKG